MPEIPRAFGKTREEAIELVESIDKERAAFIRTYFGKEWPCRALYNLMINSEPGDEFVVEQILQHIAALENRTAANLAAP